jgi:hypothetical protein
MGKQVRLKAQVVGEENRNFQNFFYCFWHKELGQKTPKKKGFFSAQMRKFVQ